MVSVLRPCVTMLLVLGFWGTSHAVIDCTIENAARKLADTCTRCHNDFR